MPSAVTALRRAVVLAAFVLGCGRTMHPVPPVFEPESVLGRAQGRVSPTHAAAKLHVHVKSTTADAGSASALLFLDRPGKGHLAVMGPLGSPLATLTTDGAGIAIDLPRDRRHLVAGDAGDVLTGLGADFLGLDDLVGLLVGDLPFDDQTPRHLRTAPDGTTEITWEGPRRSSVVAVLDTATGNPTTITGADEHGKVWVEASYGAWEALPDGAAVPEEVALVFPGGSLEVRYKSWNTADPLPAVFDLAAAPGFTTEPLEVAALAWLAGLG